MFFYTTSTSFSCSLGITIVDRNFCLLNFNFSTCSSLDFTWIFTGEWMHNKYRNSINWIRNSSCNRKHSLWTYTMSLETCEKLRNVFDNIACEPPIKTWDCCWECSENAKWASAIGMYWILSQIPFGMYMHVDICKQTWTLWENQCIKDLCNLVKVYDYPQLKITQSKFAPWRMSSIPSLSLLWTLITL
jgi:hypothetical protein